MRRADNKNRDRAMCQHLDCFAAQHDRRYSTPAVRCHDDEIAEPSRRRVDNGLIRVIVLDVYRIAVHARGQSSVLRKVEIPRRSICRVPRILSGVSVTMQLDRDV